MNVLAVLRQLFGKAEIVHYLFTMYDQRQVQFCPVSISPSSSGKAGGKGKKAVAHENLVYTLRTLEEQQIKVRIVHRNFYNSKAHVLAFQYTKLRWHLQLPLRT